MNLLKLLYIHLQLILFENKKRNFHICNQFSFLAIISQKYVYNQRVWLYKSARQNDLRGRVRLKLRPLRIIEAADAFILQNRRRRLGGNL